MRSTPLPDRNVVILDEWEATESRYLIEQRGYRPQQITIVNANIATAATASRTLNSLGFGGAKAMGRKLGDAVERLAQNGKRIHAIHADFCANVTSPIVSETLQDIRVATCHGDVAVAVNMLRGRELGEFRAKVAQMKALFRSSNAEDAARVRIACQLLSGSADDETMVCVAHLTEYIHETYKSTNGQTFLYVVGRMERHGAARLDLRHMGAMMRLRGKYRVGTGIMPHELNLPFCFMDRHEWWECPDGTAWASMTADIRTAAREKMLSRMNSADVDRFVQAEGRAQSIYASDPKRLSKTVQSEIARAVAEGRRVVVVDAR